MATNLFGISTGFDSAELIDKLLSLKRRPIELKIDQKNLESLRVSQLESLRGLLESFQTSTQTLNTRDNFFVNKGTFNQTAGTGDVVSLETTSTASPGSYSLDVTQLAQQGKVVSDTGYADLTSNVTQGTLDITVGGVTTMITIDASNDTLEGLQQAINNAGIPVEATILNDGAAVDPLRLVISGTDTGAANAVSATLLSLGPAETFSTTQTAQDALLTLDGVAITKTSNTIDDIISGVTLTLESVGTGSINISTDTAEITTQIESFVDEFNSIIEFINANTTFDSESFETGLLFGNSAVQSIESRLRGIIGGQVDGATGSFEFLSQIGITTDAEGLLTIDNTVLSDALASDPEGVSQLFISNGTASDSNVSYVGFSDATVAGSYDVQVSALGVPQLSPAGAGTFVDAVPSGSFYTGAVGTDAEGLIFSISTLTPGSYGSIDLTLGVAEQLNRELEVLVDSTISGPLTTELNTLTSTIDDLDESIEDLEFRLGSFEDNLRRKFVNLEIILGQLDTQRTAMQSALAGLNSIYANR